MVFYLVIFTSRNQEARHAEMSSQLFANNSDGDEGERKQEQSKHAEAERRACLAGDREVGTQERRRGSTCTH